MFSTTIGPLEYVFSSGLRPQTGFELPFILLLTSLLLFSDQWDNEAQSTIPHNGPLEENKN